MSGSERAPSVQSVPAGDVTVRMPDGKLFRCACGCNVFRHPDDSPSHYRCNSCEVIYEGK